MSNNGKPLAKQFNLKEVLNEYGIVVGFIAIIVIFSVLAPNFFTASNAINILRQVSCIGIATIAVGILIIMNCIDLSIGSIFALSGVTAALTVSTGVGGVGMPAVMGYVVGILTGVAVGLFNGVIIAKGRIPAFIVTMGSMSIARGLALVLAHGMPVGSLPEDFTFLGTESLDGYNYIPWTVIMFILVIIGMSFVMKKLPIGRYIYAIGGNEDAAKASGIHVDKVKIQTYLIEGALVGFAATLLAARLKSAAPNAGQSYELDAIAGSIIGGVSFTGGIGTVGAMVLGALLIGVINNGMDLLGVDAFYKQIVKGAVIVIAVLIDRKRSGRA